ncbi:predicted protein [Nematostella vectensis]|uniref:Alanine--glyoxylate aminotransferase n=1 Tax=Nematostella vectensis TaxID=45351 RepID=A7SHM7_NEMVE|nr:2-aminoethylphosphonate--pyruvate transaminase [Nematostella vectensis]EDO36761.1 predicted protein [Nematostella vectensis]|eukprot:XP_001628824.1 predicted protein [Nematostella vectensis]
MALRLLVSRTARLSQRHLLKSPFQTLGIRVAGCSSVPPPESSDEEIVHPKDKKLFTPGPLGTSFTVKKSMLRDVGSRDEDFIDCVHFIRSKLLEIAGVSQAEYTAIPLQGSGTYAVEAVITTATPKTGGKLLVIVNGSYGKRMVKICEVSGIETIVLQGEEAQKVDLQSVENTLKQHPDLNGVCIVHCETSTGVIHPVEAVGKLVRMHTPNAFFFVDAMSSFGAVPLNLEGAQITYMVSSANKCIEGVPGFSFVLAEKKHLLSCRGQSRTLSLDIVDQFEGLEKSGQFRFTPATHAMLAFRTALRELAEEGGVIGRAERYMENRHILHDGMRKLGFKEFLDDTHEGYIITSFFYPKHPNFDFTQFYKHLSAKDQVIYPGKVTEADCFRIGNIGHLFPKDMEHLLKCIEEVLADMDIPTPIMEQ